MRIFSRPTPRSVRHPVSCGSIATSSIIEKRDVGSKMSDHKKPFSKPQVAETPIADVFESRHPSTGEKEWAEKTLAPTLEKSPEKPIGAPTDINLDEHGQARFTTL